MKYSVLKVALIAIIITLTHVRRCRAYKGAIVFICIWGNWAWTMKTNKQNVSYMYYDTGRTTIRLLYKVSFLVTCISLDLTPPPSLLL